MPKILPNESDSRIPYADRDLIISKTRVKNAARKCNVGSEFYGALDAVVRDLIKGAEGRATGNKRKTLKAVDL